MIRPTHEHLDAITPFAQRMVLDAQAETIRETLKISQETRERLDANLRYLLRLNYDERVRRGFAPRRNPRPRQLPERLRD